MITARIWFCNHYSVISSFDKGFSRYGDKPTLCFELFSHHRRRIFPATCVIFAGNFICQRAYLQKIFRGLRCFQFFQRLQHHVNLVAFEMDVWFQAPKRFRNALMTIHTQLAYSIVTFGHITNS